MLEETKRVRPPMLYLKIFGERNTGSNYLHRVCQLNFLVILLQGDIREMWGMGRQIAEKSSREFEVRQALHDLEIRRILHSDFGWKHAAPDLGAIGASEIAPFTRFVVLTKHPYSWLRSLHRNPYSFKAPDPDFSRFIRTDFPVNQSDGLPGVAACNPAALLRHKAVAYQALLQSGLSCVHVRYESLLQDFGTAMQVLGGPLLRKTAWFVNIDSDVKGARRNARDFRKQYALDTVKNGMSERDIGFIKDEVGADIFSLFGYEL